MSLSPITLEITTNSADGTSSYYKSTPPPPSKMNGPGAKITYLYSTPSSISADNDKDLQRHLQLATPKAVPSFPAAGASAAIVLDVGPNPDNAPGFMHKTKTLDYVFIIEGEMELLLDGGEKKVFKKGDVVIQRACTHAWRNVSKLEPARMICVAVGAENAVEGGMEFPKAK